MPENEPGSERRPHKLPAFLASWGWVAAVVVLSLTFVVLTGRDGLFNLYFRWGHEEEYGYGFLR